MLRKFYWSVLIPCSLTHLMGGKSPFKINHLYNLHFTSHCSQYCLMGQKNPKIVCWWSVNTCEVFPSSLILINNDSSAILEECCWNVDLNKQLEFVSL